MQTLRVPEPVSAIERTDSAAETRTSAGFRLALACVLIAAAVMYCTFALYWGKFSRAEVFFAECAREMISQNNMVTPLYHGQPFFDKPILAYWLIISMFKGVGISHWAARVPSIGAALVTVGLTAWATLRTARGAREQAGILAAMMLGSSFMFFSFAYLCMSDMLLVMFDTITLILFYAGVTHAKRRSLLWWLASVSMGFAFVTKGPVGIVLPGMTFVAYLGLTKQLKLIRAPHVVLGALTAAAISFPWFFAAYKANGSWALAYFFIRENIIRYAGAMYDTHKPVWFMVQSLAVGFLPWTPLLPFALRSQWAPMKENIQKAVNDPKLFMWIWTAVLIGFFSFSRGKCDYYALPVYPAVSALVAMYIAEQPKTKASRNVIAVVSVLFLVVGCAAPFILSAVAGTVNFTVWWMMPTALVLAGATALYCTTSQKLTGAFLSLFIGLCFAASGFAAQLFPPLIAAQSIGEYSKAISASPAITRVGVHEKLHHWVDELTFQSHREPVELKNPQAVAAFFTSGPALVLLPEDAYHSAIEQYPHLGRLDLKILDRRRVSSHPLTPGYIIKRKGNIYDRTLLLVSN